MLQALLYESRADARLTDAELEVVLIGSRVRNARRGITGAMVAPNSRVAALAARKAYFMSSFSIDTTDRRPGERSFADAIAR
jgi:hypothetical protein